MDEQNQQPQQPVAQPPTQPAPAPTPTTPAGQPQPNQTPKKGYGKRPMWQWVLLYVIVAVVVYGLVYLLFIHKSGSSGY